jgi:hypothetical protein
MLATLLTLWVSSPVITAGAPPRPTPLEAKAFARVSSHEELLGFLQTLAAGSSRMSMETIGTTAQGRSIPMVHVLPKGPGEKLRVLLFCQQHGNEPSGKEAALLLLSRIAAGQEETLLAPLDLYLVPSCNPDGNEAAKRQNGAGADLNRDHLLLSQPETRALHTLFQRVQPAATLDVHEYAPFGKAWLATGRVRAMDEQFGAPTNLNVPSPIPGLAHEKLFPHLQAELGRQGLRFFEYVLADAPADTARFSTTSINDGRQSFAIQGSFSFILEGRNGRNFNDDLRRRTLGQLAALKGFLGFLSEQSAGVRALVRASVQGLAASREPVVVQMDYQPGPERLSLPVQALETGAASTFELPFTPVVKALRSVERPSAYVIPSEQSDLIRFLDRHAVSYTRVEQPRQVRAELSAVTGSTPMKLEGKNLLGLATETRQAEITLRLGDVVVPLAQRQGTMLAIALEPTSMWGLVQDESFAALRTPGRDYPVYRLVAEPAGK